VWPRDEFPARTIMKRHPEERLLAATKDLLFPGLDMSVAERTEQQVLRPRVRPQDDASYLGRGRLVAALPRCVLRVLCGEQLQRAQEVQQILFLRRIELIESLHDGVAFRALAGVTCYRL
jgi:hypothetical protein